MEASDSHQVLSAPTSPSGVRVRGPRVCRSRAYIQPLRFPSCSMLAALLQRVVSRHLEFPGSSAFQKPAGGDSC